MARDSRQPLPGKQSVITFDNEQICITHNDSPTTTSCIPKPGSKSLDYKVNQPRFTDVKALGFLTLPYKRSPSERGMTKDAFTVRKVFENSRSAKYPHEVSLDSIST